MEEGRAGTDEERVKKVLLISYYYPPMPAVGGLRAKGLAKYLPEFGWEVVVLHGSPEPRWGFINRFFGIHPYQNLLAQAEELKRRVRPIPIEWALRLYAEWFAYPDPFGKTRWIGSRQWKWSGPQPEGETMLEQLTDMMTKVAKRLVAVNEFGKPHFDAVMSTSSPVRCHILAKRLKDIFGAPWIADFRDLWTQNHYYPYSRFRLRRERRLELETLSTTDALVTVSEPLAKKLGGLYQREVHTITNGYDPEELNNGSAPLTEYPTVTYTGSVYRGKQSPEPLFRDMVGDAGSNHGRYVARFYGPKQGWIDGLARKYGVDLNVEQHGAVSREEALRRQRESHELLLLKWQGEQGIYTNKLFEYMAARRPILAVGPPDPVLDGMVEDANRGDIEKYSQREMARKFAELLDEVTG